LAIPFSRPQEVEARAGTVEAKDYASSQHEQSLKPASTNLEPSGLG